MTRLQKAISYGGVYCITTSLEDGLMLPANPLVKLLICASLFRAHLIFPELSLNHLLFNGRHVYLAQEAREVHLQWKQGDLAQRIPIKMFAPAMPRRANLIASL